MKNILGQETPFSRDQLWTIHNVVAHPAMEILKLFGNRGKRLGKLFHDITCPEHNEN